MIHSDAAEQKLHEVRKALDFEAMVMTTVICLVIHFSFSKEINLKGIVI